MTRDSIKKAYEHVKKLDELTSARLELGRREFRTLKLLANEVGYCSDGTKTLLDLGCADRFLEPICRKAGWNYIGLDYTDVDFERDPLPLGDQSIDIAVSLAVIEHIWNPTIFLSEIHRCLKPGGLIYISTPNFKLDWKNFFNDPTHVRPYTPVSLEILLKLSGFDPVFTYPGLRCKPIKWYKGKYRFIRAYYLLPFRNDTKWPVPDALKGHTRSIFGVGLKGNNIIYNGNL